MDIVERKREYKKDVKIQRKLRNQSSLGELTLYLCIYTLERSFLLPGRTYGIICHRY